MRFGYRIDKSVVREQINVNVCTLYARRNLLEARPRRHDTQSQLPRSPGASYMYRSGLPDTCDKPHQVVTALGASLLQSRPKITTRITRIDKKQLPHQHEKKKINTSSHF